MCPVRQAETVVGAGLPANTGAAGAILRVAWFASKLASTGRATRVAAGGGTPPGSARSSA
ncbi:hypothetical protein E3U47_19395 [Pseudomonas sp. RIT623]|nr:hypothetical protein E3U47_19395 [Pseudomonas sp. RIT623]